MRIFHTLQTALPGESIHSDLNQKIIDEFEKDGWKVEYVIPCPRLNCIKAALKKEAGRRYPEGIYEPPFVM